MHMHELTGSTLMANGFLKFLTLAVSEQFSAGYSSVKDIAYNNIQLLMIEA